MKTARTWLAGELRQLATDIELKRVLAFSWSQPHEIVEVTPEEGDTGVRRAFTGVRSLFVTYTKHPLVTDRVDPYLDGFLLGPERLEGEADGD
jgi:hypothetical protein